MTAITINPMVVALRPTNGTIVRRIQPTEHGGGVKKVLAVVVAVAIPIAAPAIASSIAASGVLGAAVSSFAATTAGAVVSSAIVGAGLGAVSAKVMGGDVKSGAIMGAIGGGIGGYGVAQSTGAGLGNVADTGIQATTNNTFGTSFGQTGTETAGLNTGGVENASLNTGGEGTLETFNSTRPQDGVIQASLRDSSVGDTAANQLSNNVVAETAMSKLPADATFAAKSGAYLKDAGSALVSKVTDPAALASLTMQAGGQLLGAALAPDPEMPPEQRELLEMRKAELAELKERDETAFNAQMDAAKSFLQQAEQYDPTYMAFQAANKEAIDQQRKLREQYRKSALGSGRDVSEAEKRRMSLDSARNVSSRYDQGFQQGLTAQNRVTQAGLSAIPNTSNFAAYTNALQSLSQDTQKAEDAAIQASQGAGKNISDLFAGFNTKSGMDFGENYWNSNKAKKKKKGGLSTNTFQGINGPVDLRPTDAA